MTSFYYNYQNPWVCCFLMQIKAIVLSPPAELTNLNNKAKPQWILVVVVKYRHRAIVLLQSRFYGNLFCRKASTRWVETWARDTVRCHFTTTRPRKFPPRKYNISPSCRVDSKLPSHSPSAWTDGRLYADVIIKISRMGRLPHFLGYGATLRACVELRYYKRFILHFF